MTLRQAALESENATLRGLNDALPEVIEKRLIGEVISVEMSTLRQRLLINRGGSSGVYRAQPVITGEGVLGQVYRLGPFSSEIILITDSEHALPVQVLRSGVRTIALGTGPQHRARTALRAAELRREGRRRAGHFRPRRGISVGLPVARVTKVERDPAQPLAQITAVPLARIEADREVLFIWSRTGHPAAPASTEALALEAPRPNEHGAPRTSLGSRIHRAAGAHPAGAAAARPGWRPCARRSSPSWSSTGASTRRMPAAFSRRGSRAWRSTCSRAKCSARTRWPSRWWPISP